MSTQCNSGNNNHATPDSPEAVSLDSILDELARRTGLCPELPERLLGKLKVPKGGESPREVVASKKDLGSLKNEPFLLALKDFAESTKTTEDLTRFCRRLQAAAKPPSSVTKPSRVRQLDALSRKLREAMIEVELYHLCKDEATVAEVGRDLFGGTTTTLSVPYGWLKRGCEMVSPVLEPRGPKAWAVPEGKREPVVRLHRELTALENEIQAFLHSVDEVTGRV